MRLFLCVDGKKAPHTRQEAENCSVWKLPVNDSPSTGNWWRSDKGMYEISMFASLLLTVAYTVECAQWLDVLKQLTDLDKPC